MKRIISSVIVGLMLLQTAVYAMPKTMMVETTISQDGALIQGTQKIAVRLYSKDKPKETIWEEIQEEVIFSSGTCVVEVGSVDIENNPLKPEYFNQKNIRFGIAIYEQVGKTNEKKGEEIEIPIYNLPYAMLAGEAVKIGALNVNEEGNIGIGVLEPSEVLEVSGTVKALKFVGDGTELDGIYNAYEREYKEMFGTAKGVSDHEDGAWWYKWPKCAEGVYYNVGKVGIGTSAPEKRLDVLGETRLKGDVGIEGNTIISGNTDIQKNVNVTGNAIITGSAEIAKNMSLTGNAEIGGNTAVTGNAEVLGNASVEGNAEIKRNIDVMGNADIRGNAGVEGNTEVKGNADIKGDVTAKHFIGDGSQIREIVTESIVDEAITTEKIADDAVTNQKIVSVDWTKITNIAETDPLFSAHVSSNIISIGSKNIISDKERTLLETALQEETDPFFTTHISSQITNIGSANIITDQERELLNTALQEEIDPQVNISIMNSLSKWNGTSLIESGLYENKGNIGIGTDNPNAKLEIVSKIKENDYNMYDEKDIRTEIRGNLVLSNTYKPEKENDILFNSIDFTGKTYNDKTKTLGRIVNFYKSNQSIQTGLATGFSFLTKGTYEDSFQGDVLSANETVNHALTIKGNRVGIGTGVEIENEIRIIDPKATLDVRGKEGIYVGNSGYSKGDEGWSIQQKQTGELVFGDEKTGSEYLTVNKEGSVLVKNMTATENIDITGKLEALEMEIQGTVSAKEFIGNGAQLTGVKTGKWEEREGEGTIYYTGGKVGIGTTNPETKLDVAGNIKVRHNDGIIIKGQGDNNYARIWYETDSPTSWNVGSRNDAGKNGGFSFENNNNGYWKSKMFISADGKVGIGTTNFPSPLCKLAVNGHIWAREIRVEAPGSIAWPDYVLDPSYDLMPLDKVEANIKELGHLPGLPSAKEIGEKGLGLGEMQAKLLEKIEELTLHTIKQEKSIEILKKEIRDLKGK